MAVQACRQDLRNKNKRGGGVIWEKGDLSGISPTFGGTCPFTKNRLAIKKGSFLLYYCVLYFSEKCRTPAGLERGCTIVGYI